MHKRYQRIKDNQEGLVSFLAVIFISILLTIIVTSLVKVMINESRVSTDFDNSSKAYYAAEAGIEDAIIKIQNAIDLNSGDPTSAIQDTCGSPEPVISVSGTDEVEYTCQLIDISPIIKEGYIDEDNSAILSIDTINDDFNNVSLWWNLKDEDFSTTFPDPPPTGSNNPAVDDWGQAPALMKVTIVEYPRSGGDFSRDDIEHYVSYLYPRRRNVAVDNQSLSISSIRAQGDDPSSPRYEVNRTAPRRVTDCNPNIIDYSCQMTFEDLNNQDYRYVIAIKALYNDANYSFEVKNGNVPLEISGNEVIIDVTGRAGTVFKRTVAKIPLRSNSFGEDYVILTDEKLCKNFDITRETDRADERGDPVDDGCIP